MYKPNKQKRNWHSIVTPLHSKESNGMIFCISKSLLPNSKTFSMECRANTKMLNLPIWAKYPITL